MYSSENLRLDEPALSVRMASVMLSSFLAEGAHETGRLAERDLIKGPVFYHLHSIPARFLFGSGRDERLTL
jgi:hypothetical protein